MSILKTWNSEHPNLKRIYGANVLFSLHSFLLIYLNSSLLSSVFTTQAVSLLYILSAVISLFLIVIFPTVLQKYGMRNTVLVFLVAEFLAVLGLGLSSGSWAIGLSFLCQETIVLSFIFLFDIILEAESSDITTGRTRSVFLTLSNLALIISPAIISLFAAFQQPIQHVYLFSAFLVLILLVFVFRFLHLRPTYETSRNAERDLSILRHNINIRDIVFARLILECFYATMVIYMPIYLSAYLDYSWKDIGIIFTIMLLPFVIFEIPAGTISDKRIGEKELLFAGLLIMGAASILIPFIGYGTVAVWATILFVTRIGASIVEVETETYFFKQVNANDARLISAFRATRPLSYILTPFIIGFLLMGVSFSWVFLVLGIVVICSALSVLPIKDTK